MIPTPAITAWSVTAPWSTRGQVEQDLILSRLIVEIANDPYLGQELVFRGGTCLNKLHLSPSLRYSEDLDYVRATATGIKELTTALTQLGQAHGFQINTRVGFTPRCTSAAKLRIKIEVNTYERSPAQPAIMVPHSAWRWANEIAAGYHRLGAAFP